MYGFAAFITVIMTVIVKKFAVCMLIIDAFQQSIMLKARVKVVSFEQCSGFHARQCIPCSVL